MKFIQKIDFDDWYVEDTAVIGYSNENLVSALLFECKPVTGGVYRLEVKEKLSDTTGFYWNMTVKEGGLYVDVTTEMLGTDGVKYAQIVCDREENDSTIVKKSNIFKLKTLGSINASEDIESNYAERLDEILAKYNERAVEMRWNEAIGKVQWRYLEAEEWNDLFAVTDVTEGASAYAIAVRHGYVGTEEQWLASLHGRDGEDGEDGEDGQDGQNGVDGVDGVDGKSAFEIAVEHGYTGTESEWLLSLKGQDGQNGQDGVDGTDGEDGVDGKSAFQIAVEHGYTGTEAEWLLSLHGSDGEDGADGEDGVDGFSAYEIAVRKGYIGTEAEWLASLKGADGQDGQDGQDGDDYVLTDADKLEIRDAVYALIDDGDDITY